MITYHINVDGSGDFPTLNLCLLQIVSDFNNYIVSDTENYRILLGPGDHEVANIFLSILRQVNSVITITTSDQGWLQARLVMTSQYFLYFSAVGQCKFYFAGVTIAAQGIFFRSPENDVEFNGIVTEGYGKLLLCGNGQVTLKKIQGVPLDIEMSGNELTAANTADGLDTTLNRMSLIVDRARLGNVETNKPASITNCIPCLDIEYSLVSYKETTAYPPSSLSRQYFERIGCLLDRINFTKAINGQPLLNIHYGGLYRRLTLGSAVNNPALITVTDAVHHSVCIDRCSFENADYALHVQGQCGELFLTNSLLSEIAIAGVRVNTEQLSGWIKLFNNRGLLSGVPMIKYQCEVNCCD
jgi:hypothetical protein